jgi:hypothetical protein
VSRRDGSAACCAGSFLGGARSGAAISSPSKDSRRIHLCVSLAGRIRKLRVAASRSICHRTPGSWPSPPTLQRLAGDPGRKSKRERLQKGSGPLRGPQNDRQSDWQPGLRAPVRVSGPEPVVRPVWRASASAPGVRLPTADAAAVSKSSVGNLLPFVANRPTPEAAQLSAHYVSMIGLCAGRIYAPSGIGPREGNELGRLRKGGGGPGSCQGRNRQRADGRPRLGLRSSRCAGARARANCSRAARYPLRAQRGSCDRIPSCREWATRSHLGPRLHVESRLRVGVAALARVLRTTRVLLATDPVRQARHRPLRPRRRLPHARGADGRRSCCPRRSRIP